MEAASVSPRRPARVFERLAALLPPTSPSPPVKVTRALLIYVSLCGMAALLVGIFAVRLPTDIATVALGCAAIAGIVLLRVDAIGGASAWSAAAFVHLALSLSLGPIGALSASLSDAAVTTLRLRTGWFRAIFNLVLNFLANMAAWSSYVALSSGHRDLGAALFAGIAAGAAVHLISFLLFAGVLRVDRGTSVVATLRHSLDVLPYNLAYGLAAADFAYFHQSGGALFLAPWLIFVVTLQGFIVVLARRTTEHIRERLALLNQAITASDDERTRISSDLHDGVVQDLVGLAFMMSTLAEAPVTPGQEATQLAERNAVLTESADIVRTAQRALRSLASELVPGLESSADLPTKLRELVARRLTHHGVESKFDLCDTSSWPIEHANVAYRIAMEAIQNIAKHAKASAVLIELHDEPSERSLVVVDDGVGFTEEKLRRRRAAGHLGSSTMRDRARVAGGTLDLESEPGAGTRVALHLPR